MNNPEPQGELANEDEERNTPSEIIARLSEKEAANLRDFIGQDEPCGPSEIAISFGEGHSGYGLYVWLTEYPEEGALFFQSAKTHTKVTKQAECGSPRQLTRGPVAATQPEAGSKPNMITDTQRLDWLEKNCFTNREGEREIHYDFRGPFREAIDKAMSSAAFGT